MAVRTVVCVECDEPLPYGRLSCPSCGALLASVAGPPRRRRAAVVRSEPVPPPVDPDPAPDEVVPVTAPGDTDDVSEPAPPEVELPPEPEPAADPEPAAQLSSTPSWPPPPVLADWASGVGPVPEPSGAAMAPGLQPAHSTSEIVPPPGPVRPLPRIPAGSWLPPTAAFGDAVPNGAAPGTAIVGPPGTEAPAAKRRRPGSAPLLADLPFDAPDDLPGWLVAIGSGIAVAGFLLPWADAIPFTSGFGYTDRWGFASSSHLFPFLGTLAVLILAILPNRLPAWLRSGVMPLAVGGLLLGVVWPYVVGAIGSDVGSLSVAVGSLVLIAGGAVGAAPRRHERRNPVV